MKKIISFILAVVLMLSFVPTAFAASDEALDAADKLNALGLFSGTGTDADGKPIYELDRAPTRQEAIVMLIRLLGKIDEAKAGDVLAVEVLDEVCEILGSALSNMACIVNPEVIVIGGGVSKAGSILTDNIQKHYQESAFFACRETKFALASLGNDAGMYGCVQLLLV